ncbi:MAG: tryptophan synthase subunit alpha [Deltaproteobacteria bacterium]|nr:tryptophan synthase subunit alpha [Deltaproteobacteria bacterium]
MTTRYDAMFARLAAAGEGAFVPFLVLGDPDPATSLDLLFALADGGADALELGIPFSDPVADGPAIQAADLRALAAGARPRDCLGLVAAFRARRPDVPVGLLVYANLVEAPGREAFYAAAAVAGVDSVLVADVPTVEAAPYAAAARAAGVAPVLIAAPNSPDAHLADVARLGAAYTYVVTRTGVTGADERAATGHRALLDRLAGLGAPPALLGFGISSPEHVRAAIAAGAAGAISGSAVVARVESHLGDPAAMRADVLTFVTEMKAATR